MKLVNGKRIQYTTSRSLLSASKESIEEKKFSKGESEEQIAEWGTEFEAQQEKTDACLRKLKNKRNRFR